MRGRKTGEERGKLRERRDGRDRKVEGEREREGERGKRRCERWRDKVLKRYYVYFFSW